MMAVEAIGVEVELPRENKGTEPDVGKYKKTGKALKCYSSSLILESFSVHLIIQWLNYNSLIALSVRPCGKFI